MRNQYNCGIYQIRCLITNTVYIGQTVHLNRRWYEHIYVLRKNKHFNNYLQRAFNKYGEKEFVYEKLLYCEEFELDRYEQLLNDKIKNKYNICKECTTNRRNVKKPFGVRLGFFMKRDKSKIKGSIKTPSDFIWKEFRNTFKVFDNVSVMNCGKDLKVLIRDYFENKKLTKQESYTMEYLIKLIKKDYLKLWIDFK